MEQQIKLSEEDLETHMTWRVWLAKEVRAYRLKEEQIKNIGD